MSEYAQAVSGLVQGAKGVGSAVDILRAAVETGDEADIAFAAEAVSNAADAYAGRSGTYGKFGFDQLAARETARTLAPDEAAGDLLASALVDLHVANTLIVAGQAAGEVPQRASSQQLEDATSQLNALTASDAPLRGMRFGFDAGVAPALVAASPTLDAAKAAYQKRCDEVCAGLVSGTKKVLEAAYKQLKALDATQLVQAINSIGQTAVNMPDAGKLIGKGLQMAVRALEKIAQLLKSTTAQTLRDQAGKLLEMLTGSADLLDAFLNLAFGVSNAKKKVQGLLEGTTSAKEKIDEGAGNLAALGTRFAGQTALLDKIISVLAAAKAVAGLFLPQAASTALFGGFYLLLMNYALLAGMDYADSAGSPDFVAGLMKISAAALG